MLTPELLKLPYVIAARYKRRGTEAYDELVGVGNYSLVRAAASFDDTKGATLSTWCYKTVDLYIRRAAYTRQHESMVKNEPSRVPPNLIDVRDAVKHALNVLSPNERLVFTLRYGGGMSREKIVRLIRIDRKTVTKWIRDAKDKLNDYAQE